MRPRHYLALALGLAAIAAIAAYVYRDTIARNAANAVLRDSGLQITGLSIDSIGTGSIDFGRLVLETAGGTEIRVFGVVLPLRAGAPQSGPLRIDAVELVSSGGSTAPAPIAAILAAILELPGTLPYSEVRISRVIYEQIAPLQGVAWASGDQGQLFSFAIEGFDVVAAVDSADKTGHRVSMTATTESGIDALALALSVVPQDGGFEISGQSTTRVSPLVPVLKAYGMLPAEFAVIDALLRGSVTAAIPSDPASPFEILGSLQSEGEIAIRHAIPDQPPADLRVTESTSLVTTVEYPALNWRASLQSGSLTFSKGALRNVPMSVSNLSCTQGIACSLLATVRGRELALGGIAADSVAFAGGLRLLIEDSTQIDIDDDSKLSLGGVKVPAFSSSTVDMTDFDGATITIGDTGWRATAPGATFAVQGISAELGARGAASVVLENIAVDDSGRRAVSELTIELTGTTVELAGLSWSPPNLRGAVTLRDRDLEVQLGILSNDDAIAARVSARHDLDEQMGNMDIRGGRINFAVRPLSGFLRQTRPAWDISAGTVTGDVDLRWGPGDESLRLEGAGRFAIDGAAGHYKDIVTTGVTTDLDMQVSAAGRFAVSSSTATVELLDVGIPVTDIRASFGLSNRPSEILVDSLTMNVLGGVAKTGTFRYAPDASTNSIDIRLQNIQLPLIVGLANLEPNTVEGSVSGVLPATVKDNRISIANGRIEGDEPGGVIRFPIGDSAAARQQFDLAAWPLSNFHFDSLGADVAYNDAGDLVLSVRMQGTNPDLDPTQPVILNLNLENNVPSALRSLRATRSIQEILEERAKRRKR